MVSLKISPGLDSKTSRQTLIIVMIMVVSMVVALELVCGKTARAQATAGTILGTVTDSSGAVVPSASVTILNTATSLVRAGETDNAGNYQVPNLLPGNYRITVEHNGFQKAVVNGITLEVNQTARYDVHLNVGQVNQQVNVNASGLATLDTTESAIGQVIGQRYVADLPLNGRNYLQLLTIGAGAAAITNDAGTPVLGDTGRTGLSYTVSGQETTSGSYLIDGVESKMNFDMVAAFLPSLDFVQEFKVQGNNFSAEFGGGPVVINVATKSGTNHLHGTAFEYIRNAALDATQIQDPIVNGKTIIAPYRQNQFGGSLGGPVVLPHVYNGKDRTFWFFDYEGLRFSQVQEFQQWEPTAAMLNGDFSGLMGADGKVIPIYDPATYDPTTGVRQQFPGNIIPTQRFSTLGKKFAALLPTPTVQNGNISQFNTFAGRNEQNIENQYNVRIDHRISESLTIFGRYSKFDNPLIEPLGISNLSSENFPILDQNAVIAVTKIFSPTTINEFHFGYNKEAFDTTPYNPSGQNYDQLLGLMNLSPSVLQYGSPSVSGSNFGGFGPDGFDVVSGGNLFQYRDTFTMIRGKHTIKVGGSILDQRPWFLAEDEAKRGTFSFIGEFTAQLQNGSSVAGTGSDVADLLLGYPQTATGQTGSTYTKFTSTSPSVFVLDNFQVRPGLTLNLGLRWDYNMHYKPEDNDLEGFCQTCSQYGEPGMLVLTKLGQVRSQVVDPDWHQWGPRLGFAWNPGFLRDTVLRGGFGIFYDNTKGDEVNMMEFTPDKTAVTSIENENPIPTFPLDQSFPLTPPTTDFAPYVTDLHDMWPQNFEWNLDLQHTFARNWLVDAAYVGSHAKNVSFRWNINQAYPDANPLQPTPIQSRRPFPLYGDLLDSAHPPFAIMNYDGLQMKIEKEFSHGYSLIAGYTFSRCLNLYNSDNADVDSQDAHHPGADYGLCGYDVRQHFDLGGIWYIPSNLTGFMGALTKGWQLNAILQTQSGSPLQGPYMPGDWANVGSRYHERLNRVCNGKLSGGRRGVAEWFDSSCFVPPAPGTFGDAGRAILTGPPFNTLDGSLFRNFTLYREGALQFRWEVFNTLNVANYNAPGNTFGSAGYDIISSEQAKRQMQFSLRLSF